MTNISIRPWKIHNAYLCMQKRLNIHKPRTTSIYTGDNYGGGVNYSKRYLIPNLGMSAIMLSPDKRHARRQARGLFSNALHSKIT